MLPRFLSRAKTVRVADHARPQSAPEPKREVSKFVPPHVRYTPERIASARVRYEQTTESVAAIAADFDMLPCSFRRMARRFNWVRHGTAPRKLPAVKRPHAEAQALEEVLAPMPEPEHEPSSEAEAPSPLAAIERMERAVMAELASVERMRDYLGRMPMGAREAGRTARTLATLTETLSKLQRLRATLSEDSRGGDGAGASGGGEAIDIDEFRRELARRIEALGAEERAEEAARAAALEAEHNGFTQAFWPD